MIIMFNNIDLGLVRAYERNILVELVYDHGISIEDGIWFMIDMKDFS